MNNTDEGYFVLGTTENGKKFRPSDWIDRLATTFARFEDNRIHYHPMVHPQTLDGQRCLYVAAHLQEVDAKSFEFVMDFARTNHLQVVSPYDSGMFSSAA